MTNAGADGNRAAPLLDLLAHALSAASPHGFVKVDAQGRIVAANAHLHRSAWRVDQESSFRRLFEASPARVGDRTRT